MCISCIVRQCGAYCFPSCLLCRSSDTVQWLQSSPTLEDALGLAFDAATNFKVFCTTCYGVRVLHDNIMVVFMACVVASNA